MVASDCILYNPAYDESQIKFEQEKTAHIKNLFMSKKSTIFVQSIWNLVKIFISWGIHFHQVSWGLEKNCGFFTNGYFLNVCCFFYSDLMIEIVYYTCCSKEILATEFENLTHH